MNGKPLTMKMVVARIVYSQLVEVSKQVRRERIETLIMQNENAC